MAEPETVEGATATPEGAAPPPDGATAPPEGGSPPPEGGSPPPEGGATASRPVPIAGRVAATRERIVATRQRAVEGLDLARERWPVVDAASTVVLRPRVVADTILAGYLALRLFILLFPLAYTLIAGFGLYSTEASGDPAAVADEVGLAPAVSASIAAASQSSGRSLWLILGVGTLGTLWAARAVLRALRGMFAITWRLPPPRIGMAPVGALLTALGVVGLLLMASFFDKLRASGVPWWQVSLVAVVLQGGLWLAASSRLPHAPCQWYQLLPGAVLFSLGLQGLNLATTLYFGPRAGSAAEAYGVLGIGLVLLSWLVVLGWVVLLSAELNAGLLEWSRRPGASGATVGDPALVPADDGGEHEEPRLRP